MSDNNPGGVAIWTALQCAALKKMHEEGLSFRQAGIRLNKIFGTSFSRCAVAGKANRMRLSNAYKSPPKEGPSREERRRERKKARRAEKRVEARKVRVVDGVSKTSPEYRRQAFPVVELTKYEM